MKKNTGKAPSRQFYFKDFLSDTVEYPAEVVGCWIKVLCKIWLNGKAGKITRTLEEFSMLFNTDLQKTEEIIKYLKNTKIANITTRNKNITITNRREVREHKNREDNRLRQQKHRRKYSRNAVVAQEKSNPSSSTSSSTSSSYNNSDRLNNHSLHNSKSDANNEIHPPFTLEQLIESAPLVGMTEQKTREFYDYASTQNYKWPNSQPMTGNVKSILRRAKRAQDVWQIKDGNKNESIADRVKRLKEKGQL